MELGIVGLGVIGKAVVQAADEGRIPVDVTVTTTRTSDKVKGFLAGLKTPPRMTDLANLTREADVVMEASGGDSVETICQESFARGKDVIINSAGALLGRDDLIDEAERAGSRIFIPSGAIIGLDGLKGASAGRMESVTMTTRKPPESLKDAPYIEARDINLDAIDEPTVIFEGNPLEACKAFPANMNVSAAVSFAGVGPHRTKLRIVCDPTVNRNIHEVEAVGEFGRSFIRIENVPSENHRTGILTYLSTFSFLRDRTSTLIVGT